MDLSRCRICLYKVEAENSKSVFAAAKDGQLISEILSRFASVQIRTSDGLPSAICSGCEEKLNILIDFRAEIRKSDSTLRSSCNADDTKLSSSIDIKDEWNTADDATTTINYEDEIEDVDQKHASLAECYNSVDNSDPLALTYFCEVCKKRFVNQKVLLKHEDFHDEDMPFKCYECETGYSREGTLIHHNKIYHSETGYKCQVCDGQFDKYVIFKQHWAEHVAAFRGKVSKRSLSRTRKRNKQSRVFRIVAWKKKFKAMQTAQL